MILMVVWVLVGVSLSSTKTTSRELEGYPVGYLADCPGVHKEARIAQSNLKKLQLFIVNDQNLFFTFWNKTAFNYHQMEGLSRHMDFSKKTVLKVIGYLDSNYLTFVGSLLGSVYKSLQYNVLLLEYQAFSAWVYPKAARLLRPVGKHTAEMLVELTKLGLDPKKLELVGLSHGGQAVSFIAKNYRRITGVNISRVTSLDPGGPCFRHNEPEDRIDASDADFVEIIHTNVDGYGMAGAVGHIDFYVNGGEFQPGDFITLPCTSLCSHVRAYMVWLGALLKPNSLIAMQCDSIQDARDRNCFARKPFVTNVVGLDVDKSKQGVFYLMTHNVFPYGMGVQGLKKKNDVYDKFVGQYNTEDVVEL